MTVGQSKRTSTNRLAVIAGAVVGAVLVGVLLPTLLDDASTTTTRSIGQAPTRLPVSDPSRSPSPPSGSSATPTTADDGAGAGASQRQAASPAAAVREVGVTDAAIKVGFILVDLGGAGRLGFAIDTGDQRGQYTAFVEEANVTPVNGRRIEPHFATYDPLNPDSMYAACLELAVDRKVFAVVATAFYGPPVLCLTRDHGVPLLDGLDGFSDEYYAASRGLLLSHASATRRVLLNLAATLDELDVIGERRVGIVGHVEDKASVHAAADYSRSLGYHVAHITVLPTDPTAAASAVPVEVQQMRSKGVQGVVLAVNLAYATMWVQQADSQQYRPQYYTSDYASAATDVGAQQMPNSYDGAIGVTSYRTGEHRVSAPEPPLDTRCRATYERRSGRQVARGASDYSSMLHSCGLVTTLAAGLNAGGATLTRAAFVDGLRRRPPFEIPFVGGTASFGPTKSDAVDHARPMQWSAECRCWMPTGPFRPTRF